jgi:vacuolar-type H+-ATPase subunit E/Vma4
MSQNPLVAKIKQDAEQAVADINTKNEVVLSAIQEETEEKLTAVREAHAVALEKQKKQLELVITSRAKQTGKIALQQAKRNQINALFDTVVADLVAQPADSYVTYFSELVSKIVPASATITTITAPQDRATETDRILTQCGLTGTVVLNGEITAGLVVATTEGVYDITLNRLVNEARAELEMEIVSEVTK